jgi:hypothetical protein
MDPHDWKKIETDTKEFIEWFCSKCRCTVLSAQKPPGFHVVRTWSFNMASDGDIESEEEFSGNCEEICNWKTIRFVTNS